MHVALRNMGKNALQRVYSARHFLWRLPEGERSVALTFDDGPNPIYTPVLLDVLAEAKIKATFFVIGENVQRHPHLVRRMVAEGHGIGGHTVTHREVTGLGMDELQSELEQCRRLMREASGVDSLLFRPPRGKLNRTSLHHICRSGYCLVHWSKTYSDYQQDGIAPLMSRMRANPPVARDVILLHDHNAHTLAALSRLIPEWQRSGLSFTRLAAAM
ncbi:MAG TPA: polysaccharide deacetylase family protein [Burkholderiaceae bacterium]|nr:polysaccharide deacetylase family protein [Burkholderiaceae bacterium]